MKRLLLILTISTILISNSFAITKSDEIKTTVTDEKTLKLGIDLGNITTYAIKDIENQIKKYTVDFLADTTAKTYNLVIKASSKSKEMKSFKFEVSIKGNLTEIKKELVTLPEVINELKQNLATIPTVINKVD